MLYSELDIANIIHKDMKPSPTLKQKSSWTASTRITVSKLATAELKQEMSIYPFAASFVQGHCDCTVQAPAFKVFTACWGQVKTHSGTEHTQTYVASTASQM